MLKYMLEYYHIHSYVVNQSHARTFLIKWTQGVLEPFSLKIMHIRLIFPTFDQASTIEERKERILEPIS